MTLVHALTGSSASDITGEEINVEDFLNIPVPDYVTIEESKQVSDVANSFLFSSIYLLNRNRTSAY